MCKFFGQTFWCACVKNGCRVMSQSHLKSFRDHSWHLFQSISGGLLPIQGPQEGSEAIFWPYFGILNNFPHFLRMNNLIEYSGLYWMNILLKKYSGFCFELNFELNHFSARFNEIMNFQNVSHTPTGGESLQHMWWQADTAGLAIIWCVCLISLRSFILSIHFAASKSYSANFPRTFEILIDFNG